MPLTEQSPLTVDALARSTSARLSTLQWIDQLLLDSQYRSSGYGLTEVRDMLLDLRKLLDVKPR